MASSPHPEIEVVTIEDDEEIPVPVPTSSAAQKDDANAGEADEEYSDLFDVILTFKCKSCEFICNEKAALRTHFQEVHGLVQPQQCDSKNKKAIAVAESQPQLTELKSEIPSASAAEDEKEVFLCAACNIIFPTEEACCNHMISVHGLKDFDANLIREDLTRKPTDPLRRQVKPPKFLTLEGGAIVPKKYRVTKDVPLKCSACPVRFQSSETMKLHEQCHIQTRINPRGTILGPKDGITSHGFKCLICITKGNSETFPRWSMCAMHLWRQHKIDCDLYGCTSCEFKTHLITKLKEHEGIHMDKSLHNFKCDTCHRIFKQRKQLKTHEKYHKEKMTKLPPPGDARWYTPKECAICKRILSDSKCLKKHISAVHNKLKPYVCNICGHTSARKAELQLHVRQHTGEKPYKCSICEFATGDHNSLRRHQLRHSEVRPYVCPFCKYRCIQSCAYKKHMMSAHPDKNADIIFGCRFCPLVSVSESLFQAHLKDHEEGRVPITVESNSLPVHRLEGSAEGESVEEPSSPKNEIKSKRKQSDVQYWMREEDSIDMVDTGGITIPAPTEPDSDIRVELTLPLSVSIPPESSIRTGMENPTLGLGSGDSGELTLRVNTDGSIVEPEPSKVDKLLTKLQNLSPSTMVEVELDEMPNNEQIENERMFGRLLGLKSPTISK